MASLEGFYNPPVVSRPNTDITPIHEYNGIYYKRDDFYRPFGFPHVNGGKVRQAFILFENMLDVIRKKHNNGVINATSVHSPQAANIAKVAQKYGVHCISAVGGARPDTLMKHPMMKLSVHCGAEIRIVAGHGMTNAVHARMNDLAKENGYLCIEMGELIKTNPQEIFNATADQVINMPDDLDVLVIPVGSAVQISGILIGLKRYNKKVGKIYGICVGPTREKKVLNYMENIYGDSLLNYQKFTMIAHGSPYSKSFPVNLEADPSYGSLDDIYEGKAHDWMVKNIDTKSQKTLFWCVGRRPTPSEVDHLIGNGL